MKPGEYSGPLHRKEVSFAAAGRHPDNNIIKKEVCTLKTYMKKPRIRYSRTPLMFARLSGNLHRIFRSDEDIADSNFVCKRIIANNKHITFQVSHLEEVTSSLRKQALAKIFESDELKGKASAAKRRRAVSENERRKRLIEIDSELRSSRIQFEESITDAAELYLYQISVFSSAAGCKFERGRFEHLFSPASSTALMRYIELNQDTDDRIHSAAESYLNKEGE